MQGFFGKTELFYHILEREKSGNFRLANIHYRKEKPKTNNILSSKSCGGRGFHIRRHGGIFAIRNRLKPCLLHS